MTVVYTAINDGICKNYLIADPVVVRARVLTISVIQFASRFILISFRHSIHSFFFHSYTGAVSSRIKQHFGIWIETFQSARFRARFPCYCRPESWLSGLVCNTERKAENESIQEDQ